jgi:type IV secretion system protein VirB10
MSDTADRPAPPEVDARPVVGLPRSGMSTTAIGAGAACATMLLLVMLNIDRPTLDQPLLATSGTSNFGVPPRRAERSATSPGWDAADEAATRDPMAIPRSRYPFVGDDRGGYGRTGSSLSTAGGYPPAAGVSPAPYMPPPPYVPGQPFGPAAASGPGNTEPAATSPLVIDIDRDAAATRGATAGAPGTLDGPAGTTRAIRATLIANRSSLVIEGTIITATLETAIDSTRPGAIRATVAEDVRGFDGRRILIPRGARLIGEYRADVQSGQRRVLATWTRLIRPDGVAVLIAAPAADALGGAGIPGRVQSNFLQRFASAVLQSALNVGVNLASRTNGSTVIVGPIGGNMGQVLPTPEARRSITVAAGKPVAVFVARDLDFSDVPGWR